MIEAFFQHQLTMKMYHFQTKNYGSHKAADGYLIKYALNFDRFMEVWQGQNGTVNNKEIHVNFLTANDENISKHLDDMITFLTSLPDLTVDLLAIRDEMVADIRQLKYLLTFK